MHDFLSALKKYRLWIALAREDLRDAYRRTWLGLVWASLSFAVIIVVKIVIFGSLATASLEFFTTYVTVGYWCWLIILGIVTGGCSVFISSRPWIKGTNQPLSIYVLQRICQVTIIGVYSLGAAVPICLFFGMPISLSGFLVAAVAFLLYLFTAVPVQLILGMVCVRFRDVQQLVNAVMRIMFFVTPILWVPADLGRVGEYAKYNPFSHYVDVIRDPLVYGTLPWDSVMIVVAFALVLWVVALAMLRRFGHRVVYFL